MFTLVTTIQNTILTTTLTESYKPKGNMLSKWHKSNDYVLFLQKI